MSGGVGRGHDATSVGRQDVGVLNVAAGRLSLVLRHGTQTLQTLKDLGVAGGVVVFVDGRLGDVSLLC